MEEKKNVEVSGKEGVIKYLPIALTAVALVLSAVGLFRVFNIYRQIIYAGQALICAYMLVMMGMHLKDGSRNYLKAVLYAYAVLEALRATILVTIGVNTIVGYVARFILIVLACCSVAAAERIGQSGSRVAALCIVVLEVALYLVFLFGFPGIMLGMLNRFLPLVCLFMSLSRCILAGKE